MSYPSTEYLNKLKDALSVYYAVFDKIKPKRLKVIEKAYEGVYDSQWDVRPIINDIEMSHLLGCNEVVIPHLTSEYERLAEAVDKLKNGYKDADNKQVNGTKHLKQYGELLSSMKPLTDLLNKDLLAMCEKDLKWLAKEYSI